MQSQPIKQTDKIFFSYTTVSPMSDHSYQAVRQYLDEFYTVGPPEVLYKYDPMSGDLAREAAKLLNCDASEITYLKNTTEGIQIASDALPLEAGDEVLVMGNEYPANLLPWLKKRQEGIVVTVIPGRDNAQAFNDLLASIGARTKAIAMSSSQCYDGYMADLDLLSRTCRQKGIFLVLDAVQSVGVRKIDLQATPVDFLVCGGQKYLRAGMMGIGFMYVNKEIISRLRHAKVGIRSMSSFDETGYTLRNDASRYQDGSQNLAGIVSLIAALRHINEVGIENIDRRNRQLLKQVKAYLTHYEIPFIDHGDQQGNIIAMPVSDPQGLTDYLKEHSIYIKPMKDVARLSFIHETSVEDVEIAVRYIHAWLELTKPQPILNAPLSAVA